MINTYMNFIRTNNLEEIAGHLYLKPEKVQFWSSDFLFDDKKNYINLNIHENDRLNRVEVFSPESNCWNLGHPAIKNWVFPKFLPTKLFYNKKENYDIKFIINDKVFKIKLVQTLYKYRFLGKFEEAYAKING